MKEKKKTGAYHSMLFSLSSLSLLQPAQKFIKMRNNDNTSPAVVPRTSAFRFCSCPIAIQSLFSMTDCILKVFNNLIRASLRKRSTKDKTHRGKARLEYQITVLVGKEGRWKRERENGVVSLSSLGFTTLFLSTYNFLCCVLNISSCLCLSHISAVNTRSVRNSASLQREKRTSPA